MRESGGRKDCTATPGTVTRQETETTAHMSLSLIDCQEPIIELLQGSYMVDNLCVYYLVLKCLQAKKLAGKQPLLHSLADFPRTFLLCLTTSYAVRRLE